MPTNTAAWTRARSASSRSARRPTPRPDQTQLLARNQAVAVNPLDWLIQVAGSVVYRWLD